MLDDFRLRVFAAVARTGGFTAASRELGVSQPAVSQHVSELEKELGCTLLKRSRDGVTLTADGERLLGYARQVLHWYDVIGKAFAKEDVFGTGKKLPESLELKLGENKTARVWTSGGDIHIELDDYL
jgi:molybdate transport repressor ModE-like protein